ncbi:hypothetical protein Tfer_0036 [Thermincola ferriacetica]|uniref:Uncharacterized protein n=1 Tax=Thermincola ferriacetica TaxID=281456 RepID=A0A0L6W5W6_9FIRM|nr:hypothetical protein [Thermincola ferriacetica]KNZ70967.1 hypothetical protein Tfer_0036 [Thermincola ferriacetica]
MLDITKENAKRDIIKGEVDIFQKHKFVKIDAIRFIHMESPTEKEVIVTVVAIQPSDTIESAYFEHLFFKKVNDKWYINKVERDV